MLTYPSTTAIGGSNAAGLSKAMANAFHSGQITIKYPMKDISIQYAKDYKGMDLSHYLYYQDFESVSDPTLVWIVPNIPDTYVTDKTLVTYLSDDSQYGKYLTYSFAKASTNSRGGYLEFSYTDESGEKVSKVNGKYIVEFDTILKAGNNNETQFAIAGTDKVYTSKSLNNGIDSGYVLLLKATNSTSWTINDEKNSTVEIPNNSWVHIKAAVSTDDKTAVVTISNGTSDLYNGKVQINGTGDLYGLYYRAGKSLPEMHLDNVKVYQENIGAVTSEVDGTAYLDTDSDVKVIFKTDGKLSSNNTIHINGEEVKKGSKLDDRLTVRDISYSEQQIQVDLTIAELGGKDKQTGSYTVELLDSLGNTLGSETVAYSLDSLSEHTSYAKIATNENEYTSAYYKVIGTQMYFLTIEKQDKIHCDGITIGDTTYGWFNGVNSELYMTIDDKKYSVGSHVYKQMYANPIAWGTGTADGSFENTLINENKSVVRTYMALGTFDNDEDTDIGCVLLNKIDLSEIGYKVKNMPGTTFTLSGFIGSNDGSGRWAEVNSTNKYTIPGYSWKETSGRAYPDTENEVTVTFQSTGTMDSGNVIKINNEQVSAGSTVGLATVKDIIFGDGIASVVLKMAPMSGWHSVSGIYPVTMYDSAGNELASTIIKYELAISDHTDYQKIEAGANENTSGYYKMEGTKMYFMTIIKQDKMHCDDGVSDSGHVWSNGINSELYMTIGKTKYCVGSHVFSGTWANSLAFLGVADGSLLADGTNHVRGLMPFGTFNDDTDTDEGCILLNVVDLKDIGLSQTDMDKLIFQLSGFLGPNDGGSAFVAVDDTKYYVAADGRVHVCTREYTEPTCTEDAFYTYQGTDFSYKEVIKDTLKGHTEVTDKGTAATCTTDGLTEGSHCSVCNEVVKEQEVIPALGHDYAVKSFGAGAAVITCSHDCDSKFTITLNPDNGVISNRYSIAAGAAEIILPAADEISRTGFSFQGWKDASGTVVTKITLSDFSKEAVEDFALTASWSVSGALSGSISLENVENGFWDQLLNKITFGLYNTNKKEVVIEAKGSGNVTISYLIVTESPFERTEESLAALSDSDWKVYDSSKPAILSTNSKCVVYVKLTDEAGQIKYISSDGIIEDEEAPKVAFEVIESSLTDSSASFSVESNESGTYYFVLVEDSADTFKDTDFASKVIDNAEKTGKITAGTAITIPVSGLKKATDYNAYLVIKDKAGNITTAIAWAGTMQSMITVTNATITGDFVYGSTLAADASNEQNINDYIFQWYRSNQPITETTDVSTLTLIGKANRGDYVLGKEDLGKYIAVVIAVLDEQYGGSALAYSTAPVQSKEITAAAVIKDKVYDGNNQAEISGIELTGVLAGDTVTAKAENAVFENVNAGENRQVSVTGITLHGEDAAYYQLPSSRVTAAASIKKAPTAPNIPSNSDVWSVANSIETVGGVKGLPEGWSWSDDDVNINLPIGEEITATAVYTGKDASNYEIVSVEIKLKRSNCNHNHIEIQNTVAATCTEAGYTGDTYCLDCQEKVQTGSEIKPLGHIYDNSVVTKEPTCMEAGERTYTCSRCNQDSYTESIDPVGHTEAEIPAVAPTCTKIGLTAGIQCSICGEILKEQEPIAMIPHAYGEGVVTKKPTVEQEGVRTFTCSVCGNSRTESIPKLPTEDHEHNYTVTVTEPTCTENGKKVSICSCGDTIEEILPPLGHSIMTDPAIAPTCTEIGRTEGSHCSVCDEILVEQSIVPALGHTYGEGVITKEPTEEEEGIRTFTCNVCKHSYTEPIPILSDGEHRHNYISETIVEPTCTEEGKKVLTCSCGDSHEETIPALGHDYTSSVTKEPTVEEEGIRTFVCSVCGDSYTEPIEKLPIPEHTHNYISTITKEPTYSEAGVRTFTCSVCGDSYTEEIPQLIPPVQIPSTGTSSNGNANAGISTPPETDNNTETSTPSVTEPDKNENDSTVEIRPDGTKIETVTESNPNGSVKETVTETKPDGTVKEVITETKADGSTTEIREVTTADNSATLNTVVETNASGNSTINSVIKTGVSDKSDTVSISEALLQEIAQDDRMNSVVIEITDTTVKSAAHDRKQTVVTVEIPVVEGVSVEKVVLTKESINTAKETGKGLKVNVISNAKDKTSDSYSVVIPAKQLAKIDSSVQEINVTINADRVTNVVESAVKNTVTKVLNKNKGKKNKTCVVSLAANKAVNAGMKVTIPVTEKTTITKGSKVYVYKYNAKTGKLVETANCRQTVAKDGSVVIAAASGTDYVISAKKLSGNKVQTIKESISVSVSKKTAKAGKTIHVNVSLPDTVSTKSEFGTEKATITYKSSDSKVASVSKSGTVTAKKSGTVTIKTTVKLASGQKITKEQKITVK